MTFHIILIITTLFCSLVAGFLGGFSIVVMPGIRTLTEREFIRSFQEMDRIIQNNQPIFMLVWVGSVLLLITSGLLGYSKLEGINFLLLISSIVIYLLAVQLPTIAVNIPLNNQLQNVDTNKGEEILQKARLTFEPRWNRWNIFRSCFATVTAALLMVLLFRL